MPLGLAHGTAALPEEQRGWAIGIVSTGGTVFLALGPLIGGGIVELAGWRWIFLINVVPITAIIAIALRWFPEAKATVKEPLDKKGLALLVVGSCAWCSRC